MIEPPLAPPWEGGETGARPLNVTAPRSPPRAPGARPRPAPASPPGETDALPLNATAPRILPLCKGELEGVVGKLKVKS